MTEAEPEELKLETVEQKIWADQTNAIKNIQLQLETFSREFGCQSAHSVIRTYDGNPKEFKKWMREIDV